MILTLLSVLYFGHFTDVDPLRPLSDFPTKIGTWSGTVGHFDQKIYTVLGVDDSFLCDYQDPTGRSIGLYIGYYKSQTEGELIHSPKNCMPGAGWNITQSSLEELHLPGTHPGRIKVIKLFLEKGDQRQIVLYWFQSRGRVIASEYLQKIYLAWDAIVKHRTDGSFVRLIAPVRENEEETTRYMETFARHLYPILEQYLPGA